MTDSVPSSHLQICLTSAQLVAAMIHDDLLLLLLQLSIVLSMFLFMQYLMTPSCVTNMRRDDLKFEDLSTSMRVCSRHFLPEDFEVTPKLRKLKVTAWPRLHPNLPHLNEQLQSARNTSSLASCRLLNENLRIEEVSAKFLLADKFLNFDGS